MRVVTLKGWYGEHCLFRNDFQSNSKLLLKSALVPVTVTLIRSEKFEGGNGDYSFFRNASYAELQVSIGNPAMHSQIKPNTQYCGRAPKYRTEGCSRY